MPGVADALDGTGLLRWGHRALDALQRHRDEINALNVFPVADSDTGTNLLATMRAAVRGADAVVAAVGPSGAGDAARTMASPSDDVVTDSSGDARTAVDAGAGTVVPGEDRMLRAEAGAALPWRGDGFGRGEDAGGEAADIRGNAGRDGRAVVPEASEIAVPGASETLVPEASEIAVAMARAATAGARGNSGIILSQVLRGIADAVADGPLTEGSLRIALRRAARLVREALSSPVEGTMLTVLDRAAERAAECSERELAAVAAAAADGAAKALGETPTQLGVLREAGVVDAGARGLLVLLDELVAEAGGRAAVRPVYRRGLREPRGDGQSDSGVRVESPPGAGWRLPSGSISHRGPWQGAPVRGSLASVAANSSGNQSDSIPASGIAMPQYEVMFLVHDSDEQRVRLLRDRLGALGDSVVVVGDGAGMWSAHVHCADAGAAVEAGIEAGRLRGIRVETLAASGHAAAMVSQRAILTVASGAGAVRLFEDAGASVVQGEVTAEILLNAIRALPQREVMVLPNGALPAHELVAVSVAARDGQREVLMLPCGSMVQGLAALAMHDAARNAVDDAFAMSESAAGTRWGALRIAPERALTMVGMCAAGDGLALVGHDVVVIDPQVRVAGRILLDRMLGLGGELVTMLIGADAPDGLAEELAAHVAAGFPGVEVAVYPGGQSGDLVQIGVE